MSNYDIWGLKNDSLSFPSSASLQCSGDPLDFEFLMQPLTAYSALQWLASYLTVTMAAVVFHVNIRVEFLCYCHNAWRHFASSRCNPFDIRFRFKVEKFNKRFEKIVSIIENQLLLETFHFQKSLGHNAWRDLAYSHQWPLTVAAPTSSLADSSRTKPISYHTETKYKSKIQKQNTNWSNSLDYTVAPTRSLADSSRSKLLSYSTRFYLINFSRWRVCRIQIPIEVKAPSTK